MEGRMRLVMEVESEVFQMSELCERYGVSRKTGYKWLERYRKEGVAGLQDRSRAPLHCPHRTPEAIGEVLIKARHSHPYWGGGKLVDWLQQRQPEVKWPAASTAQEILKQAGLIEPKRRRRRRQGPTPALLQLGEVAPHEVLTADFKGEFRTRDRRLLKTRVERTQRKEDGTPFASTGVARLSRLSVWWIRLGIQPLRIQPGHPEQKPGLCIGSRHEASKAPA